MRVIEISSGKMIVMSSRVFSRRSNQIQDRRQAYRFVAVYRNIIQIRLPHVKPPNAAAV
jgi:hypothetical protein